MNIVIIYGGRSCESDISVLTALSVYKAIKGDYSVDLVYMHEGEFYVGKRLLDPKNYHPFTGKKNETVYFRQGKMYKKGLFSRAKRVDCVLNCCHGGEGENGSLAGLLEIAGIAYTSCEPLQSAICMDKVFTKYMLRHFRMPTLPFHCYRRGEERDFLSDQTYPIIIKPASLGSSIGISFASDEKEGSERMDVALTFDEKLLIEPALEDFREYTCAVFSEDGKIICSQIEEVVTNEGFYGFEEKYRVGDVKRIYPAPVSAATESKIYRLCEKIYSAFELKGVVRVDFLEADGRLFINEINAVPGALSWYLFKDKGYGLKDLCRIIIEEGIKRKKEADNLFTDFPSTILRDYTAGGKGKCGKTDG